MPVKTPGHRFQRLQPLKLSQELLGQIGLRPEDVSLLASRLPCREIARKNTIGRG